jgi:hypothetical protein
MRRAGTVHVWPGSFDLTRPGQTGWEHHGTGGQPHRATIATTLLKDRIQQLGS